MKKHQFAQSKWRLLHQAITSHNQKSFWSLVAHSTQVSPPSSTAPIPSENWTNHFTGVFSLSVYPSPCPSLPTNLPDWSPVTPDEVLDLIATLKLDKAPGPDNFPSEILTTNPHWWAEPLANLFTLINKTGQVPESWLSSTIIPIYKKGDASCPSNYRPISLLSNIGKLYSKFLLTKLLPWAHSQNLPGIEQIGFRAGASTLDHAFVLSFLAEKYTIHHHSNLYVAFVDLKGAFDSINRDLLWGKLSKWRIDPRLLFLLRRLHTLNFCQVRPPNSEVLTSRIPVLNGVRQGCILAPLLFNLFLADLPSFISKSDHSPPALNGAPLSVLLYADDMALLSLTKSGLRSSLTYLQKYCSLNHLFINSDKTKIMVFSKRWSPSTWSIGSHTYQQVKSYKYLGIVFHHKLSWTPHKKSAISSSSLKLKAISKFHYSTGNQFVPAALRIFHAQILSQLLYGVPIWISLSMSDLDQLASSFFRKILGLPNSIRLATISLELGSHLPSTIAWSLTLKYWLRLFLTKHPDSLVYALLKDPYSPKWLSLIHSKLTAIDIPIESLFHSDLHQAHSIIKDKLYQKEFEQLKDLLNPTCSPKFFGLDPLLEHPLSYFNLLTNPIQRRAFMLARFNIFPSAIHYGRLSKIPKASRLCLFCHLQPDTLTHILFECPAHSSLRRLLLNHWTLPFTDSFPDLLPIFLSDRCAPLTKAVASYLTAVMKSTYCSAL